LESTTDVERGEREIDAGEIVEGMKILSRFQYRADEAPLVG
jgi:hypothetical protein